MRVLVDQDDVIASWATQFDQCLDDIGEPAAGIPRRHERVTWDLLHGRTEAEADIIAAVLELRHFYSKLDPIDGAVEALHGMLDAGFDVRIVTAPWPANPTCASDKTNWVRRHLGNEWGNRVIQSVDKTLIRGDVLIDDRPTVTGEDTPSWEHILFTAPYNAHITDRRRITDWNDWEEALA